MLFVSFGGNGRGSGITAARPVLRGGGLGFVGDAGAALVVVAPSVG